jgi:hypothetical protein
MEFYLFILLMVVLYLVYNNYLDQENLKNQEKYDNLEDIKDKCDDYNDYNDEKKYKRDNKVIKKIKKRKSDGNKFLYEQDIVSIPKKELNIFKRLEKKDKKPEKIQDTNCFNDDFFSFRDITSINTSIFKDPVDKINDIVLDPTKLDNKRIQDIYNEANNSYSLYNNDYNYAIDTQYYDKLDMDINAPHQMDLDILYGITKKN